MRAVVQRVTRASVTVEGVVVGAIERGLVVYLGVAKGDDDRDRAYIVDKVVGLRVFEDEQGKMNRSVSDEKGAVLVVSQFTLYGDVRSGKRPSFDDAMPPADAERAYEAFVSAVRERGLIVATGVFRANMLVETAVDGPVTILLDSRKTF
jgi:D-aminoacyl-tRNA deacylase